jgi:hypothetical protein
VYYISELSVHCSACLSSVGWNADCNVNYESISLCGSEALISIFIESYIFWNTMPCSPLEVN